MSKYRDSLELSEDTILVDYYMGAYGPTLRIDIQREDRLSDFAGVVGALASGKLARVSLAELGDVLIHAPLEKVELEALKVDSAPITVAHYKRMTRVSSPDDAPAFSWAQSILGWKHARGLIDGLYQAARQGRSGHQYLTREGIDDVLVELAFRE